MGETEFVIERYTLFGLSSEQRKQLLDKVKNGIKKSHESDPAIVAYLDILEFSQKKDYDEIEDCLFDFPGAI